MKKYKYVFNRAGFTLFELLAVMMIMAILATIAVPSYRRSQIKARESALAEDLYQMRRAIDTFYADLGRYPETLEALVDNRYLRDIPVDPFTHSQQSWNCLQPQISENGDLAKGECYDVRSGSDLVGFNQVPYRQW